VAVTSSIPACNHVTASILYALHYSSLLPYATRELRTASVMDMTQRAEYYCSLLEVLRQLARPATSELLHMGVEGGSSVAVCVEGMLQSASQFKKMTLSHRQARQAAAEAKPQQQPHSQLPSPPSTSSAGASHVHCRLCCSHAGRCGRLFCHFCTARCMSAACVQGMSAECEATPCP
jgi:hypothetical protein